MSRDQIPDVVDHGLNIVFNILTTIFNYIVIKSYGLWIIDRIVPKYGNRVGCVIVSALDHGFESRSIQSMLILR